MVQSKQNSMSIEKEFVPYQESLELKELGFDEPCFGEYRQWDGGYQWLQLYQDLDGCSTDPADYEYTTECKSPTFSQAFRFFREKYKLKFIISEDYYWIAGIGQIETHSYEEAELACLRKLIEIVKEKQ
jgi:hypothetical protein